MELSFDVLGDDEVLGALEAVEDALRAKTLQRALLRAAAPTVELAKALAPRGNPPSKRPLHTTIRAVPGLSRRERRRRRSALAADLGVSSGRNLTRAEGQLVEEAGTAVVTVTATAPHALLVERGHRMVVERKGLFLTTRSVVGFVAAHPFLRPAWDATRAQVAATFRAELLAAIRSAVATAGRSKRAA